MARLSRVHFAGMGENCARFHPLTLDFRHKKNGAPQDSVIWLRNGGGKTTLISLLYSVLVPNQNQFLGRLLGKDNTLTDFLRPNELGVVVTEWDFPALGTARRVVGEIMLLKDRELKRRFFSFYAVPGFGFDQLPVLGLGTPARSIDAVLDALREAERRNGGGMDLVIPEDQTQWEKHLDERGLDPFLFRLHLKMNKQEGGASDLFKLKAPEDFLRLFLELVFDERTTEELEKSLVELREKIARAPDREAAISFGQELLKSLRPFAHEAAQRSGLRDERAGLTREMATLATAIRSMLAELDQRENSLKAEKKLHGDTISDQERQRALHVRYKGGYERLGREFRVRETEAAWKTCKDSEAAAMRRQQLLEAAVAWCSLSQKEADLKASVERLEALLREHRPEFETLRRLGAGLAAAWDARLNALKKSQSDAASQREQAQQLLKTLHADRVKLSQDKVAAEGSRDAANSALIRHDEARRRLREEDLIGATETGKAALTRWEKRLEELVAQGSGLKTEADELNRLFSEATVEREQTERERQQRQAEWEDIQRKLETADNQRGETAALPAVRELCEGVEPDLRNPHLLTQLESLHEATEARLIELGIADEEDRRSIHHLEHDGLLAPSVDVTEVLRRLQDAGVRSALPVYRWLAEHRSVSEALELLREYPAAYAGVLIQNPPELAKAQSTVQALNVKMPVLLLTADMLPVGGHNGAGGQHTVLPGEHGLFSTKEAAMARPRLEERRHARETERDAVSAKGKQAHEAALRVREFNRVWPQERIAELTRKADGTQSELATLKESLSALDTRLGELQEKKQTNQTSQVSCATELATVKGHLRQIRTFITEHENHAERWKNQHESSVKEIDQIGRKLRTLDEEQALLEEMEHAANARWLELAAPISAAQRQRDDLPSEYVGELPTVAPAQLPEELEAEFRNARAAYEGKVQKGPLEGRIEELGNTVKERRATYERVRGKLAQQEIETAGRIPALDAELEAQKQVVVDARAATSNAKRDYDTAMAQRPDPREYKEGTDTNDSLFPRPVTSQACEAIVASIQARVDEFIQTITKTKDQLGIVERGMERIQSRRPLYTSLQNQVQKGETAEVAGHPEFADDDGANQALVNRVCRKLDDTDRALRKTEEGMRRRFDKEMHPLITGERFAKRNIPFRERLVRLAFDDFALQAEQQIRAVEDQVTVCRAELEAQEQEKRILVQKLDTLARQTANLFEQAGRVSEMPETMGAWAKQPFLRITLPRRSDPTERQVLLGQAVDRWFQTGQNIPRGHELAYECLIALCGTKGANIRILKPEYHLRAGSHDIMDIVNIFSDGEKLTTAVVLYCILVRLRARQKARAEHLLDTDSGLLLLDNPFGKSNLATFVDLQLQMARLMGVQLIYSTGINDFSALKHFPHYVRLRNSSRGKTTNDYHVTSDPRPLEAESVQAVTLGINRDGSLQRQ